MPAGSFPTWKAFTDLPQRDITDTTNEHGPVSRTVHYGARVGEGYGLAVVSYNPAKLVRGVAATRSSSAGFKVHGLRYIAGGLIAHCGALISSNEGQPHGMVDAVELLRRHEQHDYVLHCGDSLVPAVVCYPPLSGGAIVVSASLLSHAVALAYWQNPEPVSPPSLYA